MANEKINGKTENKCQRNCLGILFHSYSYQANKIFQCRNTSSTYVLYLYIYLYSIRVCLQNNALFRVYALGSFVYFHTNTFPQKRKYGRNFFSMFLFIYMFWLVNIAFYEFRGVILITFVSSETMLEATPLRNNCNFHNEGRKQKIATTIRFVERAENLSQRRRLESKICFLRQVTDRWR